MPEMSSADRKRIEKLKRLAKGAKGTPEGNAAQAGIDRILKKYGHDRSSFEKSRTPKKTSNKKSLRPEDIKPKAAPPAASGHKITINFSEPICTDRQFAYIRAICRYYGIPEPMGKPTWTAAHDWLNAWSPKYKRDRTIDEEVFQNMWD
jgi:hypothetical protein